MGRRIAYPFTMKKKRPNVPSAILAMLLIIAIVTGCATTPTESTIDVEPVDAASSAPIVPSGNDFLVLAERSWESEEAALAYYEKALEENPGNSYAAFKSGEMHQRRGEYDLAEQSLKHAITLDPGFAHAYIILGYIARERGEFETAVSLAELAVISNPDVSEARLFRASLRMESGDELGAKDDLFFVVSLGNTWEQSRAHNELGHLYAQSGRDKEALESFGMSIEITPEDASPYISAARLLSERGKFEDAFGLLETAVKTSWDPEWVRTEIARLLVTTGEYEDALKETESVLEIDPDRIDVRSVRGQALTALKRYDEAIEDFERYLEHEGWDSWVRGEYARALLRIGRVDEALREVEESIDHWWENVQARALLAEIIARNGDMERALDELRQALEIEPYQPYLLIRSAILLEVTGDADAADSALELIETLDRDTLVRLEEYIVHNPETADRAKRLSPILNAIVNR